MHVYTLNLFGFGPDQDIICNYVKREQYIQYLQYIYSIAQRQQVHIVYMCYRCCELRLLPASQLFVQVFGSQSGSVDFSLQYCHVPAEGLILFLK